MRSSLRAWILPISAALVVAIIVVRNRQDAAVRSGALERARSQSLKLSALREENRLLESHRLSADERSQLEEKHAEADALRARLAELQREAAAPRPAEDTIPAGEWANSGRETPRAAILSVLWAASRGDVDSLAGLVGFAPDVRAQADALFARLPPTSQQEYGSPEKVVATLLAGNFPKDASAVAIFADRQWGQDAAIAMQVDRSDGNARINQFQFHHGPEGWQLLVPASVMSGYEKILLGDPQPAESGAQ